MPPARAELAPTSSSTKNALPSARVTMSRTRSSGKRDRAELVDQAAYVGGTQRLDLDPLDAGHARPFGDLAAERVTAVEVVGAVGRDEGDGRVEAAAEEEAHQVAGRLVGPVEVLDDQQQRALAADGLGEGVDAVEQGGLVGRDRLGVGRLGQHPLAGQETEQRGVALARPRRRCRAARGRSGR